MVSRVHLRPTPVEVECHLHGLAATNDFLPPNRIDHNRVKLKMIRNAVIGDGNSVTNRMNRDDREIDGPRKVSWVTWGMIFLLVACSHAVAQDNAAKKSDRRPTRVGSVLVFAGTGWYRHPETAAVSGWLARLADETGMQIDVTENPKDLSLLGRYDVLVLNNANELTKLFDEKQRAQVRNWYRNGGGIVALHAALVHQTEWEWFMQLAGCDFDSDSEFLEATVRVEASMCDHPTVRGHGASFKYSADWTNHTRSVTKLPGFKVLLRVDESTYDPVRDYFKERGGKAMGTDHPIAWLHQNEGGRFFYTELGHDVRSLDTDFGRQHIIEAIKWAAAESD